MSRGKRDFSKGPENSYWGMQLRQFLDGGKLDDVKRLDILCFDNNDALNAARAFRSFKKHYNLPIDISKDGCAVSLLHLNRTSDICYETVAERK